MVVVPFTAAVVALFALAGMGLKEPLWAYLFCFIAFDVAHVWATAYVTYLDGERFKQRRALYLWPIPVSFVGAFALHEVAPWLFWSALSYFAIYHFAKQQYGFIAIYKAKAQERSLFDYRLDKLTLWTGAFGPVLLWHATPLSQFDWFDGGERFLIRLPEEAELLIAAAMAITGTVWVVRQVQAYVLDRRFNVGKTLWMVGAWVSWWIGVRMTENILVSAAFLNFFHGAPFLMLTWHRVRTRWRDAPRTGRVPMVARLSRSWLPFYGALFAIAFVEEVLWDGFVWRTYLPLWFGMSKQAATGVALSAWVALLSLPQIVHYFLDAFIWKLDGNNPDLREALGLQRPPPATEAAAPSS